MNRVFIFIIFLILLQLPVLLFATTMEHDNNASSQQQLFSPVAELRESNAHGGSWLDSFEDETGIGSKSESIDVSMGAARFSAENDSFSLTATSGFDAGKKTNVSTRSDVSSIPSNEIWMTPMVVYTESFDGPDELELSEYDDRWINTSAIYGTTMIDQDERYGGNGSLRIRTSTYTSGEGLYPAATLEQNHSCAEVYMRYTMNQGTSHYSFIKSYNEYWDVKVVNYFGAAYQKMRYMDGTTVKDTSYGVSKETWYKLKVDYNYATKTYSGWIDGGTYSDALIASNCNYYHDIDEPWTQFFHLSSGTAWTGVYVTTWFDNLTLYGYPLEASWESDEISLPAEMRISEMGLSHYNLTDISSISKVQWLVDGDVKAEYDTEVTSGTSTHITENNLTSGSFMDVDDDLTIKVYFRSNQARSPALTGIEGRFESIEGTLISEPISADTGCNWDTLFIDKSVPSPEKIQVTILDNSGSTIPGFANMTADGEIDISAIDISAYPTLKLKAHFLGHTEPVVLNAWGASWKYPNAWRDTFYGGAKIADTAGINSTDGRAEGSHSTGVSYLNSTDIEIPDGYHPDTLIFNTSSLNGTYINITLIDVVTDTAIAVYYGSSSSETDLTGMTGISQQLRLSANFQFDNKTAPALYDWSLNWSANRTVPKKEGCVDIDPNTLNLKSQGNWITVYIEPKDGRDPENINVSTVIIYNASRPNETVAAELWPTTVGDHDNDSLPDRMVKFDRAGVQAIVGVGNNVTLWVEGYYEDGTHFKCSDAIRVINPPDEPHNNGKKK